MIIVMTMMIILCMPGTHCVVPDGLFRRIQPVGIFSNYGPISWLCAKLAVVCIGPNFAAVF